MSASLVISDISITVDEDTIKHELMRQYNGIKNVSRWYFDGDEDYPMSCVQVDFDSKENMKKILDQGNIIFGGICRRVSVVQQRQPLCYRCQKVGHTKSECNADLFNEKDLMNIFTEQKRQLTQVMKNIEVKLNEFLTRN